MLRARSSARLKGDSILAVMAGPGSNPSIKGIRVRNAFSKPDGELLVTGLFVEAWGVAESPDEAVALLAQRAAPYLQLVAVAANASVDEPEDLLVYAPPTSDVVGQFLEQKPCSPPTPAATVRSITIEDLGDLANRLDGHPDQERIHRAAAHYRQAVRAMDPINRVMSAEHLYMACENLGQVVFRRVCRQCEVKPSGEGKHQLATEAGFTPKNERSSQHLNDYDSHLRVTEIFAGDRAVYDDLRAASDGFEHGYAGFDKVQSAAHASADAAFSMIRRAILNEAGVPADSPLFDPKFDHVLGGWQPRLQVQGTYTSDRNDDWPLFYGTALYPEIVSMKDENDQGSRTNVFRANASGASLLDGQTINIDSSLWTVPLTPDRNMNQTADTEVVLTKGDSGT